MKPALLVLPALLLALQAHADAPAGDLPVQAIVPTAAPAVVVLGEEPGSEITVRQGEGETLEEFRRQGRLYKIKVTPTQGTAYFLVEQTPLPASR